MASLGRQLTLNDLDGQDVIMYSPVQARYFNELSISTVTITGATPRRCGFPVHRGVPGKAGELEAVWRGDSSNPTLLRLLRAVLPHREWTTDDLVEDFVN